MKLSIPKGCDNAPKKDFLVNINMAYTRRDLTALREAFTDKFAWNCLETQKIVSKDDLNESIFMDSPIRALCLEKVLTHGREGAVMGKMTCENGIIYAFSEFYEFSGAKGDKVKSITRFIVPLNHG
ncbi:hypothetical protein [Lishizhenia sp.]|uniref:hypothetical protein n=1 Tax=Lishizhenia sp. TaxID=2497594 RepID=UPI00299DFE5D|nr:hypothetical protein [Lishizhenia sp.]MDX1446911.1 hypothetical protein [Lishizhenia sp.]